jgi:hypothetical protein
MMYSDDARDRGLETYYAKRRVCRRMQWKVQTPSSDQQRRRMLNGHKARGAVRNDSVVEDSFMVPNNFDGYAQVLLVFGF